MNFVISPGARTGAVRIPASKSQAHRLLICAALGKAPVTVRCDGLNADILATAACLRALGANIAEQDGALHVEPIKAAPDGLCVLPCGESGSTLRFLLPVVGALGADAVFLREGRLPERPLEPLLSELVRGGMMFRSEGGKLFCSGKLAPGEYTLPGNISSQYISALLFALPRLAGDSALTITGARESEGYKQIITEVTVIRQAGPFALCRIGLITGRTHQIRAHLAYLGHPVLGDIKYGNRKMNERTGLKTQALCAQRLTFGRIPEENTLHYLSGKVIKLNDPEIVNTFDRLTAER